MSEVRSVRMVVSGNVTTYWYLNLGVNHREGTRLLLPDGSPLRGNSIRVYCPITELGQTACLWYYTSNPNSKITSPRGLTDTRAYALPLLQDTITAQNFFEKTRVQSGGEALSGNAVLGRVSLQQ
jgi:hypothetical protein